MSFWLLYDDIDYEKNMAFAALFRQEGQQRGMDMRLVLTSEARMLLRNSRAELLLCGQAADAPRFVVSRSRSTLLLHHLEAMGLPVYNSALVSESCNDKRRTHQLCSALGLPMLDTVFLREGDEPPQNADYPVVVKPACSHGGDRVALVRNEQEWRATTRAIWPEPALMQRVAGDRGRDKRVYVLFGQPVAAVERRAKDGFLSNYSQGGDVAAADITDEEREIVSTAARALPLAFAGVDFLYDGGRPVLSEIEDVVGCRMLYKTTDINIVGRYLDGLLSRHG